MRLQIARLVLLAFFLHALLPVGYMLASTPAQAGGGLTVVLCTGQGMHSVTLDKDGKPAPSHAKASKSCPYAAASIPVIANDSIRLERQAEFAEAAFVLTRLQFSQTPLAGATSARGPPARV